MEPDCPLFDADESPSAEGGAAGRTMVYTDSVRFLRSKQARFLLWALAEDTWTLPGEPLDEDGSFDADHIIRHTDGGQTKLWNLRATHAACNRSRGKSTSPR
jgi:5-methylcytosine-specific restriction endonuclease McrA